MLTFEIKRLVIVMRRVKLEVVHVKVVYFDDTYQLEIAKTFFAIFGPTDLEDTIEVVLSDQSKASLIWITRFPHHARENHFNDIPHRTTLPLSVDHIVW